LTARSSLSVGQFGVVLGPALDRRVQPPPKNRIAPPVTATNTGKRPRPGPEMAQAKNRPGPSRPDTRKTAYLNPETSDAATGFAVALLVADKTVS